MQKAKHDCESRICSRIVVLGLLVLCVAGRCAYAQTVMKERPVDKAISLEDVVKLLKKGVPESEIIKQIEQYKVNFELTKEATRELIRASASDKLLEAIERNLNRTLLITSPRPNEEVGGQVRIEGRSMKVPGKHLWVFLHRKGLRVWWPQGGEVEREESGEWMQVATVGEPRDVGFQFEIVAMWVSDSANKSMNDYLEAGERTGRYPGIPLPEGSPVARVTVRKTAP